jgi:radical SAM enzyme (rSAM/lipoprotein system)
MKNIRNKLSQCIFNIWRKNETSLHELNYIFWECTQRCNLNCLHCGSDCIADSSVKDLPFDDFLKAILPLKKTTKPDSITIAITGGEALMREDLAHCGRELRKNGFHWGIVTNGYNYTPEIHNSLLSAGMGSLTLSLDGLKSSHNWLRANDQSFDRAVDALGLITTSPRLTYDVVTCVNPKNIDELEQLKDFLIVQQVKAWRLFAISPIGRAAQNNDLILNSLQLKKLMDFIIQTRSENRIKANFGCDAYLGEYEGKVKDSYSFCRAGIHIGSVLIDGSISACPNINRNFVQGNIYQDSFLDVWNNRFKIMRDRKWTKTGICLGCKDYCNCNGGAMHLKKKKKDSIMSCIHQKLCENKNINK